MDTFSMDRELSRLLDQMNEDLEAAEVLELM